MLKERKSANWFGLSAILVVICIVLFAVEQTARNKDCEEKALAAAVNQYPISEYTDVAERSRLQETYRTTYMESCR